MPQEVIEGSWTGYFIYGEGYPFEYQGRGVPFTIDFQVSDGLVRGTCVDDIVKKHFQSPATIEGAYEKRAIRFIKRYPGKLTGDEHHNPGVDMSKPSHEIHYKGKLYKGLFKKTLYFKGRWHISVVVLDQRNIAHEVKMRGKWKMSKV